MKNIVTIGGGTGSFMVLSALKHYPVHLSAIVAMADDGGSTGILRDELGVLPPGDVRQCLVALSTSDELMRELMGYRFQSGRLKGHSVGNILLSALEKFTGSFDAAVEKASDILRIEGKVIPATLNNVQLAAHLRGGKTIWGQVAIHASNLMNMRRIALSPKPKANPKAIAAIRNADFIIIGPGDFYSSLVPNLLIPGIPEAIQRSKAKKIYICNLMGKAGHTGGLDVGGFVNAIESYLKSSVDYVVFNKKEPPQALVKRYAREGRLVSWQNFKKEEGRQYVGADLLSRVVPKFTKSDPMKRNLVRHDSARLARLLAKIIF